jgi:integrase
MQAVISNSLLRSIEPADKPFEVRDTQLKGLLLRIQPSGVMSYYAQYARGKRKLLGRADALTPTQARENAKVVLAEAYSGRDPMSARRNENALTFAAYINDIYMPWAEVNIRTHQKTVARLKNDFPDIQKKKLNDVTPWLVEKWRSEKLKLGAKKTTVNRSLDDLKSSLAKAVEWGLIDKHPIAGTKRLRTDTNPEPRFLSYEEQEDLILALKEREGLLRRERDSANDWRQTRGYHLLPDLRSQTYADHLTPMVILSLHTGLRRGELFSLSWADAQLEGGYITVRGTNAKSLKTRHIPLNSYALECMVNWHRQKTMNDGLVFPGKDGKRFDNVNSSWRKVMKNAQVVKFRWHDLRHTFASHLVMAGVDLNTVRELLGHSDLQMTLRYAHLSPNHKAAAVERLAFADGGIIP